MKIGVALLLLFQDSKPTPTAWGRIEWTSQSALLRVDSWPGDGKLAMPRLNNPLRAVYLEGDPARTPLKFEPGVSEWWITRPAMKEGNLVVVETVGAPHPEGEPVRAQASADGSIALPAHLAVTHGKMLRYEPQPHKNTVGYWVEEADWCEWKFTLAKPGVYAVRLLQGCGTGQGGSAVKLSVGGQSLDYTVEDTGGFQKFVERPAGTVTLGPEGVFTLEIRPVRKAKAAVMDLREVRLVPSE